MTWAHKARGSEGGEGEGGGCGEATSVFLVAHRPVHPAQDTDEPAVQRREVHGRRRPLRLTVALTAARDGLLIEVADTGIGIPEDELATIFERFRQADSSISRRYGGSGLGLALVKEMAELLGGRATVQSEVGVGSVFRASHSGAVMGKDELIEELWGEEYLDGAISIAVYVRKIREKIEENPAKPAYLKTVWGVGYSFEA